MKKVIGILSVLTILVSSNRLFAQSFEGTVYWTLSIPQLDEDKHDMIVNIKGQKSETDVDMGVQGAVKVFTDRQARKSYVVMNALKMGWVSDLPNDSAAVTKAAGKVAMAGSPTPSNPKRGKAKAHADTAHTQAASAASNVDIKPTGKTATIAGHAAQEYVVKGKESDISIWASNDFPKEFVEGVKYGMGNQPGQSDPAIAKAMKQLTDQGMFPVKVVATQAGEVAVSLEFVKYEQKPLDDALFAVPTNIKYQPAPHMGGGMN